MSILSSFSFLVSTTCQSYIELCFLSLFGFLIIAIGSRRDKRVAGVWQVYGRCVSERVAGVWQVCGRCVAVGRFCVAVVPRLCGSLCGRCVVSAWQLVVGRQVCLTIGPVKIMVEKPPNSIGFWNFRYRLVRYYLVAVAWVTTDSATGCVHAVPLRSKNQ